MSLRILLIGNGGREHALAWKLGQSPNVECIIVVPGNGGTAALPKATNNSAVAADDYPALVQLALKERINLVVPGPEAPLVDGIEGFFRDARIPCFGPSKEAARMEGSKTFSKDFMKKHSIPTATFENFSDYEQASQYLKTISHNVVIKATGLAAGKGVIIPQSLDEAQQALKDIMLDKAFGHAGDEVVIEEFLTGDELSILSFCDGTTIRSLPAAQDHKRIGDGDTGLNTGGMGCYAPTKIATPALIAQIEREILQPTIDGMRSDGFPFRGCLFTGLMITPDGPRCLEYNVRFGDPETQTVLPLLVSDLADIMLACVSASPLLKYVPFKLQQRFSATVVVSAPGYPSSYPKNILMQVALPPSGTTIFHAGTKLSGDSLLSAGGRVIAANAVGETLRAAVDKAYEGVKLIQFEGMHYRKDIAYRAFRDDKAADKLTYAQSGVSIDAGNDLVNRIKAAVSTTRRPGADAEIGGFGGEVDLSQAGYPGAPIVVGAIDGVGTKLIIAQKMNKHDTVGIDLVAMNVNDLVVQGAEPIMFLDYYGCSKLDVSAAASFVEGVAKGCIDAGCALVGGETAEMPDLYTGDDYDAAGAAIGIMRSSQRLPRKEAMVSGDVLVALASSGVHSNGFSLVRRVVEKRGLSYTDDAPWDTGSGVSVGQSLLTPTRIYVKPILKVLAECAGAIKGMAHITGGGLTENVPRMLPSQLAAEIDVAAWEVPPVFKWLRESVAPAEMARTFNNGIGMVLAVSADGAAGVVVGLEAAGEKVYTIGHLVPRESGNNGCVLQNLDTWAA
ncbi:phosphoribosylglycinamide synthetase [Lasiosphaeria miniovina]|uniref:Phosphoribosylglycinamide synthetase n=1 Tax=Lasiosphaeria miniovina TaxID=1954250 RepID=A0AA40AW96_9PEZI|nr:phosphoribosylglycinamide synthetase [Lasiosphaeria miniovina]KAK0723104.1 phosphoribosylglycinamide synthetase [Lasiosphaeria miniovina]